MPANTPPKDGLSKYRDKRSPGRTPEPFGSVRARAGGPLQFVVQKHGARRLHYDFRLELGGVLVSWAVPRGPALDPKEKRLAVHVENHPLEYAEFEGVIPEGNYGAGAVIVWDRGSWEPLEDPQVGLREGSLKFLLRGYKLRGEWTLVRTKRPRETQPGNEWLLIKKPDGFADPDGQRPPPPQSVLSGLTLEEMGEGAERARGIRDQLARLGAREGTVDPLTVDLTLCEARPDAFSDPDWIYELKYDGYRMVAGVRDGQTVLRYRGGKDASAIYPEISLALRSLPYSSLVIDGEVVVFDADGRTDFGLLQQRAMLSRPSAIRRATFRLPATYVGFDLLELEGYDARDVPLIERKRILGDLLPSAGVLKYSDHIEERGVEFFEKVRELELEGIVAKRADSPYPGIRSRHWFKIRFDRTDDFAVIGYRKPDKAARVGFRSLHLAVRDHSGWLYAGRVGSGFDATELASIQERLDALGARDYDLDGLDLGAADVMVEPSVVCTVRYREWRVGRHVRQPTFLHVRDDKLPEDCVRPRLHASDAPLDPGVDIEPDPEEAKEVVFSNLTKVFWPVDGYTKGDLIEYYRAISPWLMPYLQDRMVVLTRYPDGIDGKSFYQKDAPRWVPDWVRTETVWSEHSQRDIHYFVCDDVESLLYLANLGTIPLHVWQSRATSLANPDWTILDLDPKGAPFRDVVAVAKAIHALCEEIGLPNYVKTSGSTGLHILIPLGGQCTYEQGRNLAGLIARVIESENRDIATTARGIDKRGGKVYIDWLQNRHGQLLVAPFSVRPLPKAPVSMPLRWREVNGRLRIAKHTIKSAVRRIKRLRQDPMLPVLRETPDLVEALERLSYRLG